MRDRHVKSHVGLLEGLPVIHGALHCVEMLSDLFKILSRSAVRGATRQFRLYHDASFHQLLGLRHRAASNRPKKRTREKIGTIADKRTLTEAYFYEAHDFQSLQRLAQRSSSDAQSLTEFSLGRD